MKNTGTLNVYEQSGQSSSKIVIHPNEGFDLGLMSLSYQARIFSNISLEEFANESHDGIDGSIHLSNNCKPGTVELGGKYWARLGKPDTVVLHYDDGKLLIINK